MKYKKEILILLTVVLLFGFAYFKTNRVDKRVDGLVVQGSEDMLLGASTLFAQNASIQLSLEVMGSYASTSGNLSFNGEIMPDGATCGTDEILKRTGANDWDCAADASGGGGGVIEVGTESAFAHVTSISFMDSMFSVSNTVSQSFVRLDWGAGGPASLSEAETITGNWVNTANPWADNEVIDTITASNYLPLAGGTLTGGLVGTNASFSYGEFSIQASASLFNGTAFGAIDCNDATDKLLWSAGLFTCGTLSVADTSLTAGTDLTLTTNDLTLDSTLTQNFTFNATGTAISVTNLATFGSASVSTNFEAGGYASASNTFIVGLDASGEKWSQFGATYASRFNASTLVQFADETGNNSDWAFNVAGGGWPVINLMSSDGTIASRTFSGLGQDASAIRSYGWKSGDWRQLSEILSEVGSDNGDGTLGGRLQIQITDGLGNLDSAMFFRSTAGLTNINIGINNISPTTTLDITGSASVSVNFETRGFASASQYFGAGVNGAGDCNDATDKLLYDSGTGLFTCGTIANADIPTDLSGTTKTFGVLLGTIDAGGATSFEIPNGTDPTVNATGEIAGNTASAASGGFFVLYDGTAERVIETLCTAGKTKQLLVGARLTATNQWTIAWADDPFSIAYVAFTSSGSNALGWNLRLGSATVPTTNVFTANRSASGSAMKKVTTFANSTISDGKKLDFVVTSASATLDSAYVEVCKTRTP